MTKVFTILSFVFFCSLSTYAQADQEYSKTLQKMFQVSGTEESYQAAIKQMFGMFREQYSDVEAEIWNELEKEFSQTSINDLTKELVPVYLKYLTLEDLKGLIQFYQTPVGQKYAKSTPMIMQESMEVGQQWGMKIGEQFMNKMDEKGY
ncbi:DUF2059 domain-containing protein [Sediminicola sp. 1XM1-17]|uniref:DUF2059 domain-containing protein n=1 Tax=Sediminicola sp. 1XM1-17 TaxID=3127702 RepID=UPI003077DD00